MDKKCSICGVTKNKSNFYKRLDRKVGVQPHCKTCELDRKTKYHHSKLGLIKLIYNSQLQHSKKRKHPKPNYNLEQFIKWILGNKKFNLLYSNWVKSNFLKKITPSCDRLDNNKTYSFDNLRVVTWQENNEKSHQDNKK